ncbi:multiple epidermal growth factor-like domains protein 10 isoform X2 [Mya arenaria]|uniref:multiple epidermal growth factor-like domains protein 10 isoform X2 n=1 Tax=Mya arenaria TaxID=6604 RepID=UPI0022E69CE0|nr:multiple epidermal growth factor-like domains protein 10 isoform X2 [Mya arenaria]
MMKIKGGSTIIAFTTLTLFFHAWCQDYSLNPCSIKCKDSVCDLYRNCLECADQNFTGGTCNRCIEGKYGSQCDLNCPLSCLSCDSATKCSLCKKGFNDITCSVKLECLDNCYNDTCLYPSICDLCKDGYFGDHCNVSCSENCRYGTCTEGGSCIGGCKDGFSGAKCELKICPVNCNCDQNNRCFGCKENYFGPSCSLTCSSCKDYQCPEHPLMTEKCNACEEGTYGNLCNETCRQHCLNNRCNQDDGSCACGKEYKFEGGKCVPSTCPANCSTCTLLDSCDTCVDKYYYGETCEHECTHCSAGTNCKKTDGYCWSLCADGFAGDYCNVLCNEGCQKCQRNNHSVCVSCITRRYGINGQYYTCNNLCKNKCVNNSCNAWNGYCNQGCVNGYKGFYCTDTCPIHCLNETCQQYTFVCVHGCDDGYYGRQCLYRCKRAEWNCLVCTSKNDTFGSCLRCTNGSYPGYSGKCVPCGPNCYGGCNSSTGECYACEDGYRGSFCNVSCASNCKSCLQTNDECNVCKEEFWGSDCLNNCSTHCKQGNDSMSTCEINSGNCKHGCLPESHGLQCSLLCDKHCLASEGGALECNQMDGHCTLGCGNGYKQTNTGCIDDQMNQNGGAGHGTSGSVIGGAVGGVFGLLTVALIIGLLIIVRRRRQDSTDGPKTDAAEENSVVYQNTSASAGIYNELTDKMDEAKPSKGHVNNAKESPTTSTNDNNLDRPSDSKLVVTRTSKEQRKTNQLIQSAGKTKDLENNAKCKTPVEDASKDVLQDKDTDDVYYNLNKVAAKDLEAFVAAKDKSYYLEEFKKLPEGLVKPHQDALRSENRPRNRYQGIYPYDDTRVKLTGGDTDFINASFVDGYRQENEYIASQGPTDNTMQDYSVFWRMVWQQKVGKIVMLTNLVEDGKPKCDQYWPDHGITKQYSEINVTCLTEDMYADFVMRTFSVKMAKEGMTVQQFHFTSWPDKGVPDDVTSLVDFRHRVLQTKSPLCGPTIVHCSAGVGRTGTYIAMDLLTREGEAEGSVDIHGCVTNIRHRRTRMIQTAQLEISMERSEEEQQASERNSALIKSNREGADIPGNLYRPRLHLGKEPGHDYINAMYVNSYKQRNHFVLAMTPLEETVADFLCLTMQEKAACIVDMGKECSLYIPDLDTQAQFGLYTVDNLRQKSTIYSVNRVLRISYNGQGGPSEHTVSHYQVTAWQDNVNTPESATHFLQLVKEVETKAASGSVIMHCKTGGGRCGLYAAVWTLLEKTGIEHEVSVFNTIRQLRARRPNAVVTTEQYAYCHDCVCEYLQSFDIYSNFS